MKNNKVFSALSLLCFAIAIVFIILSICDGVNNNMYLILGLSCTTLGNILNIVNNNIKTKRK